MLEIEVENWKTEKEAMLNDLGALIKINRQWVDNKSFKTSHEKY